jgi:Phage tail sheath protein subtilisin-like domain/Phage tail sheath C-terminal domain
MFIVTMIVSETKQRNYNMPIQEGGRFTPNDRIVSPGVFTRENDLSGLTQGIADIGAAIVAPFPKGPAFSPTLVTDVNELESKFGLADGVYYGPYTAKEYLSQQGRVTICRVGALTGYKQKNPYMIYAVPGDWDQENLDLNVEETGSYSYLKSSDGVSNDPMEIITYSSTSASLTISAEVVVNFANSTGSFLPAGSGSAYAGTTYVVGTINLPITASSYYITSSLQGSSATDEAKLLQALNESTLTTSCLSASYTGNVNIVEASAFYGTAIVLKNPVFKVLRAAGGCGSIFYLVSGSISGSYGEYTGTFTTSSAINPDPCISGSDGDSAQILAVLANTQYTSQNSTDLSLPGFSGSLFNHLTASVIDVMNTNYSIVLRDDTNGTIYGTYDFSMDSDSSKYITSVFGTDATAGGIPVARGQKLEVAYLYKTFEDSIARVMAEPWKWKIMAGVEVVGAAKVGDLLNFTDAYSTNVANGDSAFSITNASTPWINSQGISPWVGATGGSSEKTHYKLFKVLTLGDGTGENTRYKIEISNVKLAGTVAGSTYGSFTLTVRDYSDTDKKTKILETFQNLNLDPNSANFIARKIGNRYNYITFAGKIIEFGTYETLSRCIRIEMSTDVCPAVCVPYGFDAYSTPIDSGYAKYVPKMMYSKASTYDVSPGKYASGIVFGDVPVGAAEELIALYPTSSTGMGVDKNNIQYFAPIPAFGAVNSLGSNVPFDLEADYTDGGVTSGSIVPSYYTADETTNVKMRKFVLGFQGGFDGEWPGIPINVGSDIIAGNTQGLDCTNIKSAGSIGYKQCIAALGNADEFDINLIATPGLFSSLHSYVVNLIVDMCETRGDCFYIMDNVVFPASNQSTGLIDAAIAEANKFDTNYAATYYPWIKILDTNMNKIISVPPSVVMPAIYASNDRVAAEWFAPAGLNRGGITSAVQLLDRTTHAERDSLYEGRVNPIAAFPGQGIAVWGQKTLQVKPSALDRINVRRLLIALKKYIASTSKYLVFEQNVNSTRNKFLSIVNPYLESVQQRSGLYAFSVKMDEQNNTPDIIDRNILYGQIWLQPARSAEFIVLDFNVMATGASFPGA